jgi:hypothetical protein
VLLTSVLRLLLVYLVRLIRVNAPRTQVGEKLDAWSRLTPNATSRIEPSMGQVRYPISHSPPELGMPTWPISLYYPVPPQEGR